MHSNIRLRVIHIYTGGMYTYTGITVTPTQAKTYAHKQLHGHIKVCMHAYTHHSVPKKLMRAGEMSQVTHARVDGHRASPISHDTESPQYHTTQSVPNVNSNTTCA